MDVSHEDVQDAIHRSDEDKVKDKQVAPKKATAGSRILGFFKRTTRVGVTATLGTDRLKAAAGSGHARNRLGVLPHPNEDNLSGPVDFKARYQGKKGYVYISTSATTPCVSFTRDTTSAANAATSTATGSSKTGGSTGLKSTSDTSTNAVFSVAINEITSLKKIGGLGWKVKLIVGWAMDREVADGLEITTQSGQSWILTAIPLREELFNRLIALGGQKWESW